MRCPVGANGTMAFPIPRLIGVAWGPSVETGASVPGYSGGAEHLSERFLGMRITGFVLADEDVSAPGPSVETGASVPGYSTRPQGEY